MDIKILGIDLAKNVFQLCALSPHGKVLFNRAVKRPRLLDEIRQLPPTLIAMEVCGGAHYWGRLFQALGHQVRLIPPQHVKPFVRVNKNDAGDALAICEAATRPGIHFVPVKPLAQQDLMLLHTERQRYVQQRTAIGNQIRGLTSEYGVIFPIGLGALRSALPGALEDAENGLSPVARQCLARLYDELKHWDHLIRKVTRELNALARQQPAWLALQAIPGVGPLVASALIGRIGNGHQFRTGRQCAAWIGLVPRQRSSGGHQQLLGITKNGDRYLRTQLIHGARAITTGCGRWGWDHPLARWVNQLRERRGFNKAVVALANKLARLAWAVLSKGEAFDMRKAFATP